MREPESAPNLLGLTADETQKAPTPSNTGAASRMMDSFSNEHRDNSPLIKADRKHRFGAALAQLTLTVALIVSIVVVLAVASASGALAQRSDLMVMEESTSMTTAIIIGVILVVMSILTMLAIRDASPKSAKRRTHATRR
jgi:hypothetical protein